MAFNTSKELSNCVIYEIFIRNHGENGTFEDVKNDIKRIKDLGVDIIWLMPFHTIGRKNKKGSVGSPYSIKHYKKVNPDYGTIDDLKDLIDEIHNNDMKVMMDVVFHHTSCDSFLSDNYPDYFIKNDNGNFTRKIKDWSDIIDFDFSKLGLYGLLLDILRFWVNFGFDGFRCDFACFVPMDFWNFARKELDKMNNQLIWLAETSSPSFLNYLETIGYKGLSDAELYEVFDMVYDQDGYPEFLNVLNGSKSLNDYILFLKDQHDTLPDNYIKLRFLENHDKPRVRELIQDNNKLLNWTAFLYLQKGATLIYAGQEVQEKYTPSLFDVDMIEWSSGDGLFIGFLNRLYNLKKREIILKGEYTIRLLDDKDIIELIYKMGSEILVAIINVGQLKGFYNINVPDGAYNDILGSRTIVIKNKQINVKELPVVIEYTEK